MSRKKVADYEIVHHGIDHEQYFQGCGVAFTDFDECFTGIGDNPHEAMEDALEQAATSDWDVDSIQNKERRSPKVLRRHGDEAHYYLSIRLKGETNAS